MAPDADPIHQPAIWLPTWTAATVVFEPAHGPATGGHVETVLRDFARVVDLRLGSDRHIVLDLGDNRHRVLVRQHGARGGHACVIATDSQVAFRIGAAEALLVGAGKGRKTRPAGLCATVHQSFRLSIMLRMLDCSGDQVSAVSLRQIAHKVNLPNSSFERAIDWKTSTQRRQAQRLLKEARRLVDGGYADLLRRP